MHTIVPPPDRWTPPAPLASPVEGVALWWCATRADEDALSTLRAWLSKEERARMARFATATLGDRYAVGRAGLRQVLGTLLGVPPAKVPIVRGERGRPRLAIAGRVDFNVSNTRQVALIGVTTRPGGRIGVDVEHRARAVRHDGLARKFCTPAELATFATLDEEARRQRFLRLWTCKEAMSKATGEALGAPLRRLDVALEPSPRLVDGPPPYTPAHWRLANASVPEDYVASVALWCVPADASDARTR